MAFVTLEDLHGSVEITVFSTVYAKVYHLLAEDIPILVQGQLQKDENSAKILADKIIPIDKAEEIWTASIHFNLDTTRTEKTLLIRLNDILKRHPGSCPAYVHFLNPDKTETVISLSDSLKLRSSLALTREVNDLFGYHVIETACLPAEKKSTSR